MKNSWLEFRKDIKKYIMKETNRKGILFYKIEIDFELISFQAKYSYDTETGWEYDTINIPLKEIQREYEARKHVWKKEKVWKDI